MSTHMPRIPDFGLGDLYEPLMPLGKGGTGETYLMRDRTTDKLVAIKVSGPSWGVGGSAPGSRDRLPATPRAPLKRPLRPCR